MNKFSVTFLILVLFALPVTVWGAQISFDDALKHYQRNDFRLLIVPGHTLKEWGSGFRGIKEGDLTVELGNYLNDLFASDAHVKTLVTRTESGELSSWLNEYIRNGEGAVNSFVRNKVQEERASIENGQMNIVDGVYHNVASNYTQQILFSINKFANDNRIDLALHIHFNDYPRRKIKTAGKYNGFAIYVPEKQLANSNASLPFARGLEARLLQILAISNYPPESSGVVEDQDLIAIGSHGTREGPSILIEYGYIYEPALQDPEIREAYLKELAYQTYVAIEKTLGGEAEASFVSDFDKTIWQVPPKYGTRSLKAFQLQQALARAGAYPPDGLSIRTCPINGSFGPCTKKALENFQKIHAGELSLIQPEKPLLVRTFYLLNKATALAP